MPRNITGGESAPSAEQPATNTTVAGEILSEGKTRIEMVPRDELLRLSWYGLTTMTHNRRFRSDLKHTFSLARRMITIAQRALMRLAAAVLTFLYALSSCGGTQAALEPAPGREFRVLFIGNSLTYFNDLPGTVAQLGLSVDDRIQVRAVARPNFALIDHANGMSEALDAIRSQAWDYVVLQQGPSALPESRDTLILATRMLDQEIRAAGGQTALLMVWPESSRFTAFDDVRDSYRLAAQVVGGLFLPAGEAWRTAWVTDPNLAFYGPDGYHPAPLGTYAAALVVYEGITGHDARGLPADAIVAGQSLRLPEAKVRFLQASAHETVARFR